MKKSIVPLLLYAYLSVTGLLGIGGTISGIFAGLRSGRILGAVSSLLGLVNIALPVVALLGILVFCGIIKSEKLGKNLTTWVVPLCWLSVASRGLSLVMMVRNIALMGFGGGFYNMVSSGLLPSVFTSVVGLVLCIVVAGMIKKQPQSISKGYRFGFYLVLFFMVFLGALAMISGTNTFGGLVPVVGIWLLPMVFVKADNAEKTVKEGVIAIVVIAVVMIIAYLSSQDSGSSYSSIVPEDLQKMGVSEKEYMEVYQYFKNGVNFGN